MPGHCFTVRIKRPVHVGRLEAGDRASTIPYWLKSYWARRSSFHKDDGKSARAQEQPRGPQQLAEVRPWFGTLYGGDFICTNGTDLLRFSLNGPPDQ